MNSKGKMIVNFFNTKHNVGELWKDLNFLHMKRINDLISFGGSEVDRDIIFLRRYFDILRLQLIERSFVEVMNFKLNHLFHTCLNFLDNFRSCKSSTILWGIGTLLVGKADVASDMNLQLQRSPFIDPVVTFWYLATIMQVSMPPTVINSEVGKIERKFVEFLLDNFQADQESDDGSRILFIDLICVIMFLMDQQVLDDFSENKNKKGKKEDFPVVKLIWKQVNNLLNEVVPFYATLNSRGEIKEDIVKKRSFRRLPNILEKAKAIKTEVRKIYALLFPNSQSFNFSSINVLNRIDSLLENLKGLCFSKIPIAMLHKEFSSLKESNLEYFSNLEMQSKHKEIKYLWTRIANVAYNAERAANSFTHMKFLWHDVLHFSDVIEECKLIKGEMKRMRDKFTMYDIDASNLAECQEIFLPSQTNAPMADTVVGFKNEIEVILDRITRRSEELDIISIVGMAGSGKTTLAKSIYASVKKHFRRHAWCTISQTFHNKRLFLDILKCIGICDDDLSDKDEEDLAYRLYKSLKGQRYLIVMDDIWDLRAWNVLKLSFPDDNVGSRIMFTSRIHELVVKAKPGCVPVPLKPLSKKESWELLEKKLFDQGRCPDDIVDIGMQIATKCKGLPLAILLIAGILKKNIENPDWWRQVGKRLDILIANEDCMDILELSYKHLPEFLKPCFLYFGSYPEDEEIRVKDLILLWISEGFIQKHVSKSVEVVANEYLIDLVDRSLVIPINKSSTGKIKTCSVHDLLREFCFAKGEEENIFKVFHSNEVSHNPHYRVCIQNSCWRSFLEQGLFAPFVHSLLPLSKDYPFLPHESLKREHINNLVSSFSFVQVLWLGSNVCIYDFDEALTELFLLTFLRIVIHSDYIFPSSIKKLQNLETLILEGRTLFEEGEIPLMEILEMKNLRHLFVRGKCVITIGLHIDTMPPLVTLRTFECKFFILPYERLEMFLSKIPNVENLKFQIGHPKFMKGSNSILKLDFLGHLESLRVGGVGTDFLHITIELYFPSTMKKLHLLNFRLPSSSMSVISKIPKLEVLKLDGGIFEKTWNVKDDEFQNLKYLRLRNLKIEELNASDNSFPCLEHLVVKWCNLLEEIPWRFANISTLKAIHVCSDHLKSSAMQIQEEQKELGNELQVLISPLFMSDERVHDGLYNDTWFEDLEE